MFSGDKFNLYTISNAYWANGLLVLVCASEMQMVAS
ncbi:hypothetical protein A8U91_01355 [Halomonas elongata]|uniref:Uncharacterized protein n=1 Tax=Halomonas elongata TaxID=2746 RepID=A0A1B8P445_HALEL|nr:hypothetical protein A8U91_01355 [Halomonas elongata]